MQALPSTHHVYHKGFPLKPDAKVSSFHKFMRGRFGVISFLLLTALLTFLPTIFISWPVFIFLVTGIVSKPACRKFIGWSFGAFLHLESYLLGKVLGIQTRIYGHSKPFSKRCLILMNHRCHFDWLFFFSVMCKQGDPRLWLAVLKYSGKRLPLLGWAMQMRNFFFVSRKWSIDEPELKLKLHFLKTTDYDYQILLFPEGTDLTLSSYEKSCSYAKENGLAPLEYCMHPKTTGFKYMLKKLKEECRIDTVYDVTVGYPDVFVPTEKEFIVDGRVPHEIHYHIRRYDVDGIPLSDDGAEQWLRQVWTEKEERLKLFYTHRKFCEIPSDSANGTKTTTTEHHTTSNGHSASMPKEGIVESPEIVKPLLFMNVVHAIVFCVVNVSVIVYMCCMYWYVSVLAVTLALGIWYISTYTKGADSFIMRNMGKEFYDSLKKVP